MDSDSVIRYFCYIGKYDYALAIYIKSYLPLFHDSYSDSLYYSMTEFKVDNLPLFIVSRALSMELYLLYHRFGERAVVSYLNEYSEHGGKIKNMISISDIAEEDQARNLFILINEIKDYGLRTTYYNRECEQLPKEIRECEFNDIDIMENMFKNIL